MKKFAVVALCGVLLLQLQGVAAQTQAQINTIMQQIATGTWLPPAYPSAGQAAAFQYANAVYIASMNSNQLVPDMAYGAQKYWDNSSVCTNPQGCQGFRCADFKIGRAPSTRNGNGFARLDTSTPSGARAFAMIQNLSDWGVVIPYPSDMKGANVFVMQQLAQATNVTVSIEVVHLPDAILASPDENVQIAALLAMGYDCVITPAVLTPEKIPYMGFTAPFQSTGFIVVTTNPVIVIEPWWSRMWVWTRTFEWRIWLLMVGGLCFSGIVMWAVEAPINDENFGTSLSKEKETVKHYQAAIIATISHGVYFSLAGWGTKTEEFAPKSVAGRILGIAQALAVFLFWAFYAANLTVILFAGTQYSQTITDITDFSAQNLPACITADHLALFPGFQNFLNKQFPGTTLQVINGTSWDLLDQINNGNCVGGLAPDVFIKYSLGPIADPQGVYCGLQTVGELLTNGMFAIPFNYFTTAVSAILAINVGIEQLKNSGAYASEAALDFPISTMRTQCPAVVLPDDNGPLQLVDLGGVFVVLALGCAFAVATMVILAIARLMHNPKVGSVLHRVAGAHEWPAPENASIRTKIPIFVTAEEIKEEEKDEEGEKKEEGGEGGGEGGGEEKRSPAERLKTLSEFIKSSREAQKELERRVEEALRELGAGGAVNGETPRETPRSPGQREGSAGRGVDYFGRANPAPAGYYAPQQRQQEPEGSTPRARPEAPRAAPAPGYRAPEPAYQAPPAAYRAPEPAYQAPAPAYQAPAPAYQAPAPAYRAPEPAYRAPEPAYAAPYQAAANRPAPRTSAGGGARRTRVNSNNGDASLMYGE